MVEVIPGAPGLAIFETWVFAADRVRIFFDFRFAPLPPVTLMLITEIPRSRKPRDPGHPDRTYL